MAATTDNLPLRPALPAHMPSLDGLRGWAVLAVMFYHFALPMAASESPTRGWHLVLKLALTGSYGVDMFFVLSGFLITGILLDSKSDPHYFKNFYMRRVLRIFPLYYGVLAVCFGMLFWVPTIKAIAPHQGWLWLYVTNFSELKGVGFEPMFSHFWSLAIEEQFYMVWPLVVMLLSRRAMLVLSAAIAVGSPVLRCFLIARGYAGAEMAANLTPTRLDGLAMGALLAGVSRGDLGLSAFKVAAILLVSIGGIGTLALKGLYGSTSNSIWGLSGAGHYLMCSATAGILCLSLISKGLWHRLLSLSLLRFFGKYSYGLYVFHYLLQPWTNDSFWFLTSWPVVSLVIHFGMQLALTLGVALLSWHLYEKQFLKLKRYFEHRRSSPAVVTLPTIPPSEIKAA
jgi:peptidoglycan/LPS O-acetylase OafA/YrhL